MENNEQTSTMKISYYVHDLTFPLVEGVRKQACWMAKAMHTAGFDVEIYSTGHPKHTIVHENIPIHYGTPWQIRHVTTDIMHYISHPSPLILPLLLRVKAKKQIM